MKIKFYTLIIFFFIISCSNESDNQGEDDPQLEISNEILSYKWSISDSSIDFIEFLKSGRYLIVEASTPANYIYGSYTLEENLINLDGYGTLIISDIDELTIEFTINSNTTNQNSESFIATKQQTFANNTTTNLLTGNFWKMFSVNGEDPTGTGDDAIILFSISGTYFADNLFTGHQFLGNWKWEDDDENTMKICYDNNVPDCSDGSAKLEDIVVTEEQYTTSFLDVIYIFKPLE